MLIISEIKKMKNLAREAKRKNKTIGFVPTMGYLHRGHLSLVEAAKKSADMVVVSVFVNPTQFGPEEDLGKYPRDLDRDKKLLKSFKVEALFIPSPREMFPPGFSCHVEENELSRVLCGRSRPGHFRGVTTVVLKLFEIVLPDLAFFGQKDFQQQAIIKKMARDLNLDVEIKTLPIAREADGLAMSSRNKYLSKKQRKAALALYQTLIFIKERIKAGEKDPKKLLRAAKNLLKQEPFLKLDYLALVDPETLEAKKNSQKPILAALAGYVGKTRLIDNLLIT